MTAAVGGRTLTTMSIRSISVSLTGTPVLLVEGSPGSANVAKKIAVTPSANITIGGADSQTFPVTTAGITLDVLSGDDLYGDGTATVHILEVSI